jgi:malate synthase
MSQGVNIRASSVPNQEKILSGAAMEFVVSLVREFRDRRVELLQARDVRAKELTSGVKLDFLTSTKSVRDGAWNVASCPQDLQDRRVEITGPVERKMMINALNSGACAFMADIEDSNSPTWHNVIAGQQNIYDAVRRALTLDDPKSGKQYRLNDKIATLLIRPRGWHMIESHFEVDGQAVSASLFDFALTFFHNAQEQLRRGTGPYFYLPKMESHLEARLWNDVFTFAQKKLGVPHSSVRVTVLIETIPAAFEMDEILYELRDHISGLNAGRWDYIFSFIKKHAHDRAFLLPDRSQVTMKVPFMKAYAELLVKTCHRRGAHAMGGMAAFVPSRKDAQVNEMAFAKVREDKHREAQAGFDGTWVAHPDLVTVACAEFDKVLGNKPNQKDRMRDDVNVSSIDLLNARIDGAGVTEEGARNNISVGIQYIYHWLNGAGAVAIFNLMEDAATAEIARAQLWQWLKHGSKMQGGQPLDQATYERFVTEEFAKLQGFDAMKLNRAKTILNELVLASDFKDFLTTHAYADIC